MRITILQDYLRVGGTERQSLFLARSFAEQGDAVTLLLFRPGGPLWPEAQASPAAVEVLQAWDSRLPLYAPNLSQRVANTKPDIVLAMGRTANCYTGGLQRRLRNIPIVATLRTGKVLFPLHAWSLPRVAGVIANSNWWQRRMRERGLASARVKVIHNPVLLNRPKGLLRALRPTIRAEHQADDGTTVFLTVAAFRRGKRHREMLVHFANLAKTAPARKWQLWLAGDGRERRVCERQAKALGLADRIKFLGYLRDPAPAYAGGDIAVSNSLEDSLPNFLMEAQAAGLPVLARDFRGVRECFRPGKTGIVVQPYDDTAFEATLHQFVEEPEMAERLGKHAHAFVRRRFDPQARAEATRKFLERLVKLGPPNGKP